MPILRLATALLVLSTLAAASAAAAPAPRLRSQLKAARLVVSGVVTNVTPYDDDRVAVVRIQADRILKGTLPQTPPAAVDLLELHEGPTRPALTVGMRGVAFLRPAPRTSYFARILPSGTYHELLPELGSFLSADSNAEMDRQVELISRLLAAARGEAMDASAIRRLTFDLLAARNPFLVEDGTAGVADLGADVELTPTELGTLAAAVLREDLPERVRIGLIEAVGKAGLRQAVPALQAVAAPPPVVEAAWRALDQLGAPPTRESLTKRLADREPSVRAAAVRELLRRDGVAAVSQVAPVAVQDPDPAVRQAAVDALGALARPEALPPLERVFSDSPTDLKQATGRAILSVGGPPAVDAFGRLAFVGPIDSQRYAVLLLMTMSDPTKNAALDRIAQTHPDEQTRNLVRHGLDIHEH